MATKQRFTTAAIIHLGRPRCAVLRPTFHSDHKYTEYVTIKN